MRIGSLTLNPPVALAPLSGINDRSFRLICRELGASIVCTGLISGNALQHRNEKTEDLLRFLPAEHPVCAQVFGAEPGVVAAAVIMLFTKWYAADPILSGLIAAAVLVGSVRVLRDAVHILLEGVPRGIDLEAVAQSVQSVSGVEGIHDLHIWTICSNILALSVHVTVGDRSASERDRIVHTISERLNERFGIAEATIQAESEPCRTNELIHVVPHREAPD